MKCPRCGSEMNGICNNCGFPLTKKSKKKFKMISKGRVIK